MKTEKNKNSLEKGEQSWRPQTFWFQIIVQTYRNQKKVCC